MSAWRLVLRSLLVYWRMNAAVALGVAAATAVLTGALLVGDSMQQSLRRLAVERLGRIDHALLADHFFSQQLAARLASHPDFRADFTDAVPVVLLSATVENPSNRRRAGQVTALGCGADFWSLGEPLDPLVDMPVDGQIILNRPLADQLQAGVGQDVLLRIGQLAQIPADSPMGRKTADVQSRRLTVSAIVPAAGLGRFSLLPNQQSPFNAFLPTETLQDLLRQHEAVNALLIAAPSAWRASPPAASQMLRRFLRPTQGACGPTLADLGLKLDRVQLLDQDQTILDYFRLTSDKLLLPPAVESAALTAWADQHPQPSLTYLANYILAGDGQGKIPYSAITAVDSVTTLGPLLDQRGQPLLLGDDEIVLNQWAADDLARQGVLLQIGDPLQITYFEPESTHGEEREQTASFRLRWVAPLAEAGQRPELTNDAGLTPETPGLTDKQSVENWDPPFPYDDSRVRTRPPNDQDEQYWEKHRLTPKAFVSLSAGRRLWQSRFGGATSLRVAAGPGVDAAGLGERLRAQLDPVQAGFSLLDVKRSSLAAAQGSTSFSGLFLGFSVFIIAAAVMLATLLFRLGVEQRAAQIGLLLAVGFRRQRAGSLLVAEGLIVAAAGGALGLLLGVGYAWLMLAGLQTWWLAAIVTPFLTLHVSASSLIAGSIAGVLACVVSIAATLWACAGSPFAKC